MHFVERQAWTPGRHVAMFFRICSSPVLIVVVWPRKEIWALPMPRRLEEPLSKGNPERRKRAQVGIETTVCLSLSISGFYPVLLNHQRDKNPLWTITQNLLQFQRTCFRYMKKRTRSTFKKGITTYRAHEDSNNHHRRPARQGKKLIWGVEWQTGPI